MNRWITEVDTNDWWLRDASGHRVRSKTYNVHIINFTDYTKTNTKGERFPETKARIDFDTLLKHLVPVGIDWIFIDNASETWFSGNYKQNGSVQNYKDNDVQSAWRRGIASYADALRAKIPSIKILANAHTLGTTELYGKFEMGMRECLMGKYYSLENSSWEAMMESYRAMFHGLRNGSKDVIFGACGSSDGTNSAHYRYGLASALLEDGIFAYSEGNYQRFPWYDESDVEIGAPVESPPSAPHSSGLWIRTYTNAMVLVNPSRSETLSVGIPPGYRKIKGKIDPTFNTGEEVSGVSLPPRSGMIIVRK